jgi:hypothetical protein
MGDFDPAEVISALETIHGPGGVVEVRALNTKEGTVSGYFDDFAKLAAAVQRYDGKETLYITMNTVKPDLLARAQNRLQVRAKQTTADHDITRRQWILVDMDAKRPAGISSTTEERTAAKATASAIRGYLKENGWPDPIVADSGNGWHLLYPIDEPNDPATASLIQQVLQALDANFSNEFVDVDLTCFNAGRITKLYGTVACKGDSTTARPHRRSRIASTPKSRTIVTTEQIRAMAARAPKPEPKPRASNQGTRQEFDIDNWISSHGIAVKRVHAWKGSGRKWILAECPWNSEHDRGEAYICEQPDGAIVAGCRHNGCSHYGWRDLRLMHEPDAYDKPVGVLQQPAPLPALPSHITSMMPASRISVVRELHQVDPMSQSDDWDEPLTLTDDTMPPFPLDALPTALRDHVEEAAYAVQTPVGMQAMAALAVLAGVNSRRCKVQVGSSSRRHTETLNLYIAIASDPGTRKSSALKTVTFPLEALETELMQDLGAEYAAKRDIYDAELKRLEWLKAQAAKAADPGDAVAKHQQISDLRHELDKGVPPSVPKLLIQDITTERLSSILAEQEDNCISLISAEGGIFSIIKGQYSGKGASGPNMDIWLKAWTGEGHKVDRVGSGEMKIAMPLLTVGVMVQPGILRSLLESDTMRDNGFLDRFLYCVPENLVGTRLYRDTAIHQQADYAYNQVVRKLYDLPKSVTQDNRAKRFTLTLSPDAVAVYSYCYDDIERRQAPDRDLAGMAGWASKFPGNVVRIAGNLHMVKCLDECLPWDRPISGETMAEAWRIGNYLIPHAREAFGEMLADSCATLAKRILRWAQRQGTPSFNFRECYHAHHSNYDKTKIEAALLKLIDHSYIRLEEAPRPAGSKGGRPPKPLFVVNPSVMNK